MSDYRQVHMRFLAQQVSKGHVLTGEDENFVLQTEEYLLIINHYLEDIKQKRAALDCYA